MTPPHPSGKRVTLRDIARELGVSHSTVSLALRDHPRISETVRKKVHQTARKMGYQPDPMLAALANYRRGQGDKPISAALAWINAWPDPKDLRSHKEFDAYWKGARKAAKKLGYRLEEFRLDEEYTADRLHQILSARGIRGLLLPPHWNQPEWGDFPWDKYSVVRFGRSLKTPCCHLVTADQVANTILAYRKMFERGYRRIGFVAPEFELTQAGLLFELGYLAGQRIVDQSAQLPAFLLGNGPGQKVNRSFQAWLRGHRPDAIFTTLPEVPEMLRQAKLKVPEDIGLAATTLIDTGVNAGIDQHPEEIGRVGCLLLNSLINDASRGIPDIFRQILVEGSWIDGPDLPHKA